MNDTTSCHICNVRLRAGGVLSGELLCTAEGDTVPGILVMEMNQLLGHAICQRFRSPSLCDDPVFRFELKLSPHVMDGRVHALQVFVEGCPAALFRRTVKMPFPGPDVRYRQPLIDFRELPALIMQSLTPESGGGGLTGTGLCIRKAHLALAMDEAVLARHHLAQVDAQDLRKPLVQMLLAECDLCECRFERAARRFYEIVKTVPAFHWAFFGLIDSLTESGKLNDAALVCRKMMAQKPGEPGFQWRADRIRCLALCEPDAPLPDDTTRLSLIVRIKQLLLMLPDDRRLTRALQRLRQGFPVEADTGDAMSDLRHQRLVLELVADSMRVTHG